MHRLLLTIIFSVACVGVSEAARIKDITTVLGVRANQLVGYGLVVGLNATGDSPRNSPFTAQSVQSMLDRMGVNIRGTASRARNVAAVIVTAELPAFISRGSRIDVTVSSLGDASSLSGGSLIMTRLRGADRKVYAVAQGPVTVSGFAARGQAETLTQGVPTTGRVTNGALVERDAPAHFNTGNSMVIELRNPDFATAVRVADAINAHAMRRYGFKIARARDLRSITILRPRTVRPVEFIARIGRLTVKPDASARVVIDERTGTIVIGSDVRISRVAVTHGNLTVRVTEQPKVSQPRPFSDGRTVVTPESYTSASQQDGQFRVIEGTELLTLVAGLNQIGLKPRGIIAILQAIKTAGALHADLVTQ